MTLMQKYFFKIKLINLLISGSLLATQPDTFINGGIANTSISAIGKQFFEWGSILLIKLNW